MSTSPAKEYPLAELLGSTPILATAGPVAWAEIGVTTLTLDSRDVKPGSLYLAISGAKSDGHDFIPAAIEQGAVAIVAEQASFPLEVQSSVPILFVADARSVHAKIAAAFFAHPSASLLSIGVTGTNGKTSVAWICANILSQLNSPACLLGTLGAGIVVPTSKDSKPETLRPTDNTTPSPLFIQEVLAEAVRDGAQSAVLEVTSQGLAQQRTHALAWNAAVFTNLTRDHLDLHGSLEAYAAVKETLFTEELAQSEKTNKTALINIDDEVGAALYGKLSSSSSSVRALSFSAKSPDADYSASQVEVSPHGTAFRVHTGEGQHYLLRSQLVGEYNVSNLLASFACLHSQGFDAEQIAAAIAEVPCVPGRLELVAESGFHVFVDYAHTPDALVNVQTSLRPLCKNRLITVFGCGGDRDRGKRPIMGQAVAELSDIAIVTSDNPRTENPEQIIDDIIPGIENSNRGAELQTTRLSCRKQAIAHAIKLAGQGDIVLVAGKGHEPYQEIMGVRHPFLDRDVCLEAFEATR